MTATLPPTSTRTATATNTPFVTATATPTAAAVAGGSYCYPQPAKGSMTIVYPLAQEADITVNVYNLAAIKVAEFTGHGMGVENNTINTDVSKFAPGIYYYIITGKTLGGQNIKLPVNKFMVGK